MGAVCWAPRKGTDPHRHSRAVGALLGRQRWVQVSDFLPSEPGPCTAHTGRFWKRVSGIPAWSWFSSGAGSGAVGPVGPIKPVLGGGAGCLELCWGGSGPGPGVSSPRCGAAFQNGSCSLCPSPDLGRRSRLQGACRAQRVSRALLGRKHASARVNLFSLPAGIIAIVCFPGS